MAKARGRPHKGELADMACYPSPEPRYVPPPDDECEDLPLLVGRLADHARIVVAQKALRATGRLVHFALTVQVQADGLWHDVARIDTSDGEIHRHQFTCTGGNHRTVYDVIPADYGEEIIDRWFVRAYDFMDSETFPVTTGDSRWFSV